ncbi:hypothetical protein CMI41_02825 [Candidatus Pacearchaeota archaeon]|nr:hypothetical protein [Candidatus Pacearchaeota archaeon]|tara:strand:+ start:14958 stop:15443 length:486 start_codon:yes stop_codon:yes gene_type:complete
MVAGIATGVGWFAPIFAFLLVFIIMFAILKKTGILGDSDPVVLFVSFIVAAFFILEAQLVDFVEVITGWVGVLMVVIFFLLILLAFAGKDNKLDFLHENNWFSWVVLIVIIILLVSSGSYVFNWVINWDLVEEWIMTDWFGFIALVVIGLVVSFVLTKKAK